MNALRNIFSSRTLNYLRQNGQNALINVTQQQQQPPATVGDVQPTNIDGNGRSTSSPLAIPRSILDACHFNAQQFDIGRTANNKPLSLSPTTLRRFRRMQRQMELIYRCKICNTRNTKTISEEAFYSGVVILQCDGCAVDHLIKDNLGLFAANNNNTNTTNGNCNGKQKMKNIEQVLSEQSGRVRIIKVNEHGELI